MGFPGEPYRGPEFVDDPGMKEDEREDTIEDKVAAHKDEWYCFAQLLVAVNPQVRPDQRVKFGVGRIQIL